MKKNVITAVVILSVLGLYIYVQAEKHTTIGELVDERVDDSLTFKQLSVEVFREGKNSSQFSRPIKGFSISDESFIQELIGKIDSTEVKQTNELSMQTRFRLVFTYQKEIEENHYSNQTFFFYRSRDRSADYGSCV